MTEGDNDIEWKDVKDNLRIIEIDESHLIDLGNPFQEHLPLIPETPSSVKGSRSHPASKLYLVLVVILMLSAGFFFMRSEYVDSAVNGSGDWKVDFRLEETLSAKSQTYTLLVLVDPECVIKSLKVSVNNQKIEGNQGVYVYNVKIPQEKVLKVDFYVDSSFFGKRVLNSVVITLFRQKFDGKMLTLRNDSHHRFLIYTLQDNGLVLQPQESYTMSIPTTEKIVIVATDLENLAEFTIVIQVGEDHGTEA